MVYGCGQFSLWLGKPHAKLAYDTFLGNNLKTDRDIWKIPKATNSKSGSPIGWSRDRRSRVVTWPAFWKLGQGATQKSGVSRSPMEISEKFQKRIIANHGSPIGCQWSRDQGCQVITWPALWKLGQGAAQKMWHISDTDGDIWKIPKVTNSKSRVADQMVTWPRISGDHVTCFLETRSRCSTKSAVSQSPMEISEKFQKRLIANQWVADRMVTWPNISGDHVT